MTRRLMPTRCGAAAALVLLCLTAPSAAGPMKPIAVFSFAGYERLARDLERISDATGSPALAEGLVAWLRNWTRIQRLEGIREREPLGAVIATDGLLVAPVAFVPVEDIQRLFDSLAPAIGPAMPLEPDLWKIGRGEVTGFVRRRDGWAYLAQSRETLVWLPEPKDLLGDLPQRYDAALQLDLRNIPEVFRTMAIDLTRASLRERLDRHPGESPEAWALRQRSLRWRFAAIEGLLTESREVTLGWTLDETSGQSALELRLRAKPKTPLAQTIAALRKAPARLADSRRQAGPQQPGPLRLWLALALTGHQVETALEEIDGAGEELLRLLDARTAEAPEEERLALRELTAALVQTLRATVESGQFDLSLSLRAPRPPFTAVAAARIGGEERLERLFELFARLGGRDPRFAGFRLAAARLGETPVHAVEFTAAGGAGALEAVFGPEPVLYIAADAGYVFLAMGPDALAVLENALSKTFETAAGLHLRIDLAPATRLVQAVADGSWRPLLAATGATLRNGDDRVRLSIESPNEQPDELLVRLEAGGGLLRAAAAAWTLRSLFGD